MANTASTSPAFELGEEATTRSKLPATAKVISVSPILELVEGVATRSEVVSASPVLELVERVALRSESPAAAEVTSGRTRRATCRGQRLQRPPLT